MSGEHTQPDPDNNTTHEKRQWIPRAYRKIIGELIILALYLALDIVTLWPISHGWAILAAIIGIVALAMMEASELVVVFIALIACAAGGLMYFAYPTPIPLPTETETHGWLLPANDPSAKTVCGNMRTGMFPTFEDKTRAIVVSLGTSGAIIPYFLAVPDTPENMALAKIMNDERQTMLRIGKCDALVIYRTGEGALAVDADVYNKDGNLAVRIRTNTFHLVPGAISYADRPDRSTLVVHDQKGNELFWIRYLNATSVKIRGTFSCEGSDPVVVTGQDIFFHDGAFAGRVCDMMEGKNGIFFKTGTEAQ